MLLGRREGQVRREHAPGRAHRLAERRDSPALRHRHRRAHVPEWTGSGSRRAALGPRSRRSRRSRRSSRRSFPCRCHRGSCRLRRCSQAPGGRRTTACRWWRCGATSARPTGGPPPVLVQSLQVSAALVARRRPIVSEPVSVSWLSTTSPAGRWRRRSGWAGRSRWGIVDRRPFACGARAAKRPARSLATRRPLRRTRGRCRCGRRR